MHSRLAPALLLALSFPSMAYSQGATPSPPAAHISEAADSQIPSAPGDRVPEGALRPLSNVGELPRRAMDRQANAGDTTSSPTISLLSKLEAEVALIALLFAFSVIVAAVVLRRQNEIGEDTMFRLIVIAMTFGFGTFILAVGYDHNQMAAVFGLFGIALGYAFGKDAKPAASA
jgi:hypothetical protein